MTRAVLDTNVTLAALLSRRGSAFALTHEEVDRFLNAICQAADCFQLPAVQPPRRPDDDEPLVPLAETSGARLITTHNLRHHAGFVRLSKLWPEARVFTLDADFRVYRRNKRQSLPLICPS